MDLGAQPLLGAFPLPGAPEPARMPLGVGTCRRCGLHQLTGESPAELDDPDAPSPWSSSTMAAHARAIVGGLIDRGEAGPESRILSIASHGGHLAQFFAERGLHSVVLDPLPERASRLRSDHIAVVVGAIDDARLPAALGRGSFDLVVDSYLLAHLPRPRTALRRIVSLLAPSGRIVIEFDHILATVDGGQWDAIRHGHHSYVSLGWLATELERLGLSVEEAEPQSVYGGSLLVRARRNGTPLPSVDEVLAREAAAALDGPDGLRPLSAAVTRGRREVAGHLRVALLHRHRIAGYGAPARSVTFLNTLGIGPELLPFVVDRSEAKQGRVVPGVGIPIRAPAALEAEPPDEVLVLVWDLAAEDRKSVV